MEDDDMAGTLSTREESGKAAAIALERFHDQVQEQGMPSSSTRVPVGSASKDTKS